MQMASMVVWPEIKYSVHGYIACLFCSHGNYSASCVQEQVAERNRENQKRTFHRYIPIELYIIALAG